jgi:multidrug efflux system membrane fusion protein
VFVVKPDLTAEVRKVAVERAEGEQAVVKGVAPGEQVVTRGALRLSPGARVEIRAAQDAAS